MGKTRFVYLDEDAGKTVAPYMYQPLEQGTDYMGEDEEIPEEDVECNLFLEEMAMLREEQEELDRQAPDTDTAVPVVTSEDLLNVGDVLLNLDGAAQDEGKKRRAASTLRAIRETDMYELVSSQVEHKGMLEELMGKYLNEDGNALPLKKERKEHEPAINWRELV